MSLVVHKYKLKTGLQNVAIPCGGKVLGVGWQYYRSANPMELGGRLLTVWALVDTAAENETRVFEVVATGVLLQGDNRYSIPVPIGSVVDNFHVFHVFEWAEMMELRAEREGLAHLTIGWVVNEDQAESIIKAAEMVGTWPEGYDAVLIDRDGNRQLYTDKWEKEDAFPR